MAKVILPDEHRLEVLKMFTYYKKGQKQPIWSYKYKNGIAYLPLNIPKIQMVANILGVTIIDERGFKNAPPRQFPINPDFNFRDYQVEPAASLLEYIQLNKYGTFSAPCGTGKTLMLTYVSGMLGEKSLTILDQSNLMDNWVESNKILWSRPTQIITSKTKQFDHSGIVTFQLLHRNPDLLYQMKDIYGCLMIDESHGVTAKTFMDVMFKFNNRYRITTSATFFNKNLPQELLEDVCGSSICVEMVDKNALIPEIDFVNTMVDTLSDNPDDWSKTLAKLAENDKRNQIILDLIREGVDSGRHILVVCITQDMARYLEAKASEFCTAKAYVGTTSRAKDAEIKTEFESGRLQVVFTCKKFNKGTDFVSIDMLINGHPNNNLTATQQLSGRVVRKLEGKPTPIIYDLVDRGSLTWRFARNRHSWYSKLGYTFKNKSYFFLDIF